MVKCIRLCLHCVDVCTATAGVVSRLAEYDANVVRPLLEACVAICESSRPAGRCQARPYGTKIIPLGVTSPLVATVPTFPGQCHRPS